MSRDGSTVRYSGAPKYNGIFGKPSYIEFSEIASPVPIEWQIGDYVDYTRTGFRYKLYTLPQVAKSARSGESGDAFVYKNVQFYCATKDLEIALFRDIVQYDNGIHFSSIPNVDTYESVYGIIDRIQANMDDFAPGQWTIRAMSTSYTEITDLMSEVREFSLSDGTCMDALNQIYNLWKGISWIYKVENGRHTIVLGRPNLQDASNTTPEFSYGEGNGLKVITRAVSTKNEIATRIYAYGSDRNLPTRYYNNLTPYIKDHESVYIPHLMLPLSDWGTTGGAKDARLAYLQNSSAVNTYGLIPKIMRFDGTGDLEDIYPSVEGMTVGDVADSDFPATGWSSSQRIDVVVGVDNPSDNGMYTEDSVKLKQDTVTLSITDPDKTYTTIDGQEAVTIANDYELFETTSAMNTDGLSGHFVIKMGGLTGLVSGGAQMAGLVSDVPKAFLEIYVGNDLMTSKELKVTSTKLISAFTFESSDVTFTSDATGILKAYIRIEMKMIPSAASQTLEYHLNPTDVKINVEYSIDRTFTMSLPQLGFDLNALGTSTVDGLATISMRSGMCAGRDFVVKECEYNDETHTWDLTCQRQDDTSLMQYFPNSVYPVAEGDTFVILDIQMPAKYVTAAETRLHNAASNALARLCKPVMAYVPEVDSKEVFMASVTLTEGLYMPIYDPDLVETFIISEPNVNWILISTVTIAENEDVIPIYGVTLRDEKVESMLQVITGELNEAQKRLRDKDVEETRKPASDISDAVLVPTVVGVKIEAERDFFTYTEEEESQTIVLTAVTQGINNPVFQWYYLGEEDWVALSGETDQAYVVENDSEIYYQDGQIVEDFRVVVTDGGSGASYSDRIQIIKLTGAVTIALNNPAHIFAGGVESALDNQTDTVNVLAFNATTRVPATVNSISGQIAGAITASVRANTNGTTNPTIDIYVTDELTDPAGVLVINVTAADVTVNLTYSWAVAFKGSKGDKGDTGTSTATIYLYKRTSGDPSTLAPGNMTYNFAEGTLSPSSALNGWSVTIPQEGATFSPVYVTMATVTGTATGNITGGWVSDQGDWSDPTRLTGDNGLMGKIMRGVNEFSSNGLPDGRPDGQGGYVAGYQGRDETSTDIYYYDVVFVKDTQGLLSQDTDKIWYFYCKNGVGAKDINPITDVVTNDPTYKLSGTKWQRAENYDFIATNVLLAENAYIDVMSGNGVYMYGNSGASDGQVVAGMQGGSTTIYGGETVNQINFFAGSTNPQTAPFRVDYTGHVTMSDAQMGFLETYTQQGLPWTELRGYYNDVGNTRGVEISPNGFLASTDYGQDETRVSIDTFNFDEAPLEVIVGHGYSQAPTAIYTDGGIKATEIMRANGNSWENVITSYDGNILRVRKMTASAYEALSTKDTYTLYIIKD